MRLAIRHGRKAIAALLCAGLVLVPGIEAANAQFGFPGVPGPRIGVPLPVPGVRVGPGIGVPLPLPGIYGPRGLGRTLGIIGAVAVGAVILHKLSVQDRREVARRAKVVVEKDQNERVVDTYKSKDGRHQVTMTAEPVQNASEFVEDPALQKVAEASADASAPKTAGTSAAGESKDVVNIKQLPSDSPCRRVTTEYEASTPANAKGKAQAQPTVQEARQSNVSIMCQTQGGTWKPAGA